MSEIKRAKKTFRVGLAGFAQKGVVEGDLLPAEHPLVRHAPDLFEDVDEYVARVHPDFVEEATANPGGRRRRSPLRSKGKASESSGDDDSQQEETAPQAQEGDDA